MTKAEELINKHLDRLNANNIIGKDGNIYKGFLNAINEALTIPVVTQRSELLLFADYSESDKVSQTTDECVDNYLDQKQ